MKSALSCLLLIFSAILILCVPSYSNSIFTPEEIQRLANIPVKIYFNGENFYSDKLRFNFSNEKLRVDKYNSEETDNPAFYSSYLLNTSRNYYDLQTNNSPQLIWQNPANLNDIHAIYTSSSQPAGWSDRQVQCYYSSDKGVTWSFLTNIGGTNSTGFASISGLSTGVALIAAHTVISSITKSLIYIDAFPGLGSFNAYNPGGNFLWPKIAGGENINLNNKYFFLSANDTLKYNMAVNSLGNFSGYTGLGKTSPGGYAIARGNPNLIGISYVSRDANAANFGDVYFMQSTNNGDSFNSPIKIFDANFATDSLAGFMGISLLYKNNNQPYVAFETVKQNTNGQYYPGAQSKIRVWSSALNGGLSIIIADTNNIAYAPARGTTDLEAPICRPSLGYTTSTSNVIYCAMMVQNPNTGGADTTSYNDIYVSYSSGITFSTPRRITPASPRNDWTYPSPSNAIELTPFSNIINLVVQRDTIPGSNVNTPNPATDAKFFYVRADVSSSTVISSPYPQQPQYSATNVNTNPNFVWSNTQEFSDIQISTNQEFTNIIHSARVNAASYQMPSGILNLNYTYYWRIRNGAYGEFSLWSYSSFTTRTTSIENIGHNIPAEYKLYNNYPNPFNPATKIKFDLPKNSFVKINIFDINGRLISELVNENLNAGSYETGFNGMNLSSGIYYCRIEAGDFVQTIKMMLVK